MRLVPPCGYKGGKRRWAQAIATEILKGKPQRIYDIGAGSAAVSLALREAGHPPDRLTLVEAGPWGRFWEAASTESLDLDRVEHLLLSERPSDPREVKSWVEVLAASGDLSPEVFLVLQAAAFGSEAVWHDGQQWRRGSRLTLRRYSARGYWEPDSDSSETKPRETIFTPEKVVQRAREAARAMRGVTVRNTPVDAVELEPGFVYVDPDYVGTSGYGWEIDLPAILSRAQGPVFVSEQTVRHSPDRVLELGDRKVGALTGRSTEKARELLLCWDPPEGFSGGKPEEDILSLWGA